MAFPNKKTAPVEVTEPNEPMPMKKKGMPMKKGKGKPAPGAGAKPQWKGVADKMLGKPGC